MTAKSGASTNAILKIAGTFGTATAGGAGDKIEVDGYEDAENAEALEDNPIGGGIDMTAASEKGAIAPSISLPGKFRYNEARLVGHALLYGAASVQVMGSGAYTHSLFHEATRNQKFLTTARDGPTGSAIEYVSCTPISSTLTIDAIPGFITHQLELLGNEQKLDSSTNTTATLAAATVAGTKRVIAKLTDKFRLNLIGDSALSDSDVVNVTNAEIVHEYPVEFLPELKNSAGNGQPVATGEPPVSWSLKVTFRNLNDPQFRLLLRAQAGQEMKADITVTGDLIGGSQYYKWIMNFPRLKIVESPDISLASTRENPCTFTFKPLIAESATTGMNLSYYPHEFITNTRATALLA